MRTAVNCRYTTSIKLCQPTCEAADDTVATVIIGPEAQNGGTQCILNGTVLTNGLQFVVETCPKLTGPECQEPCPTSCKANVTVTEEDFEGLETPGPLRKLLESSTRVAEVDGQCSGAAEGESFESICPAGFPQRTEATCGQNCGDCCIPTRKLLIMSSAALVSADLRTCLISGNLPKFIM